MHGEVPIVKRGRDHLAPWNRNDSKQHEEGQDRKVRQQCRQDPPRAAQVECPDIDGTMPVGLDDEQSRDQVATDDEKHVHAGLSFSGELAEERR